MRSSNPSAGGASNGGGGGGGAHPPAAGVGTPEPASEVFETSRDALGRPRRNIGAAGSSILRSRPSSVDGSVSVAAAAADPAPERPRSEPSAQQKQRGGLSHMSMQASAARTGKSNTLKNKKKKPVTYQPRQSRRPSLSEQLAAIGSGAAAIGTGISKKFGLDGGGGGGALLRTPAQAFTVGKLAAKHPSPVVFFRDRCTYSFFHPFQAKEIQMIMYYKDMRGVSVSAGARSLSFRLDKRLAQFGADYDPRNPAHRITIGFSSTHDMARLQEQVMQFLRRR